jgi:hypothetical protein
MKKSTWWVLTGMGVLLSGVLVIGRHGSEGASSSSDRSSGKAAERPELALRLLTNGGDHLPWNATSDDSPRGDDGYVPASEIHPPAPTPIPIAPPREPLDPATHTPPMDNPGGVDGDRSPRPLLAIESNEDR